MAILSYSRGAFVLRDRVGGSFFDVAFGATSTQNSLRERSIIFSIHLFRCFPTLCSAVFRFPFNVSFAMRGPLLLSARGWRSDGRRSADVVVLNLAAVE
jgi:hypothetical protein